MKSGRPAGPLSLGRRGFGHERYIGFVAILGILLGILIPRVTSAWQGARDAGEPVAPAVLDALLTHWYLSAPLALVALAIGLFVVMVAWHNYLFPLWERLQGWWWARSARS